MLSNLRKSLALGSRRILREIPHQCAYSTGGPVERTALYDFHVKSGGKIVDFGGFALPVQYADQGIAASHLHTRRAGSIFDVSHMLQTYVRGKHAVQCIEAVCTADIQALKDGSGTLTVFTNPNGGILDDLIVTKINSDLLYVVSNAAMKAQDKAIMENAAIECKANGKDVCVEFLPSEEQSLVALQGPKAVATLRQVLADSCRAPLDQLYFMHSMTGEIAGVPGCRITRCGYTGEDGVEISVPSAKVEHVVQAVLSANSQLRMAGLGARDSLRIEAGLCLYGTDINADISPVEGNLNWLVAKRRRTEANFPGAARINEQLKQGVSKVRIGLAMAADSSQPPARHGVEIYYAGKAVGKITSGCPSPSIGRNIAMGYIETGLRKAGTPVQLKIRGKLYDAETTKMPFVQTNYYSNKK